MRSLVQHDRHTLASHIFLFWGSDLYIHGDVGNAGTPPISPSYHHFLLPSLICLIHMIPSTMTMIFWALLCHSCRGGHTQLTSGYAVHHGISVDMHQLTNALSCSHFSCCTACSDGAHCMSTSKSYMINAILPKWIPYT